VADPKFSSARMTLPYGIASPTAAHGGTWSRLLRERSTRRRETAKSRDDHGNPSPCWQSALIDLGDRLAPIVGREGYRALLARSLHLASADFAVLRDVQPGLAPPGRLVGLRKRRARQVGVDVESALCATCAALMSLLEQFLGRELTYAIVREAWPATPDNRRVSGADRPRRWPKPAG
jgi:hypothetical protein